jgi:hypothetical protein
MNSILNAWIAEILIITYRGTRQSKFKNNPLPGFALPSEYVATIIVFGGLSLVPSDSEWSRVAGAIGWGLVLATTLNLWNPTRLGGSGVSQASPVLEVPKTQPQKA